MVEGARDPQYFETIMPFPHQTIEPNNNIYDNLTGIALSDRAVIIISTIGFASLGIALYVLILRRGGDDDGLDDDREGVRRRRGERGQGNVDDYGEILAQSDVATLNRAQRRARAKFRMKKARRAAAPNQQFVEDVEGAADDAALGGDVQRVEWPQDDARDDAPQLTRKERQKAAKAIEKEERKQYAEEARLRREKESQSRMISAVKAGKESNSNEKDYLRSNKKKFDLDQMFPIKENEEDPLSEYLFWESIMSNLKNHVDSSNYEDRMMELEPRKMTIHAFLQKLQNHKCIPIASLAHEFGITIPEVLKELQKLNLRYGIVGLHDGEGRFVYISKKMIEEAILSAKREGKILPPNLMGVR